MKANLSFLALLMFVTSLNADNLNHWLRSENIPQPKNNPITKQKVELGKLLFFDKRLSSTDIISCASCHDPKHGWSDGRSISLGVEDKKGRRNSPTIINSAYLNSFFHDGRANSLEDQARGPIEDKVEMNMPMEKLVEKLKKIKGYRELFFKIFGEEGITKENIVKAIATFERTLITSETPFDKWVKGDKNAISLNAKEGFLTFKKKGKCNNCHNGFNFTNESFNNVGLGDKKDLGVYELSKSKIWYGSFKTPTLIDVEKTAPYFHDGSVKTLEEAVTICGNGGRKNAKTRSPFFRDRGLDKEDVSLVVAFLKTLTAPPIEIDIPLVFPK